MFLSRTHRTDARHGVRRPALMGICALAVAATALSACDASTTSRTGADGVSSGSLSSSGGSGGPAGDTSSATHAVVTPKGSLRANVRKGAGSVKVDKVLKVTADKAELTAVEVRSEASRVQGTLAEDGVSWQADGLLEPGTSYTLKAVGTDVDGTKVTRRAEFSTADLSLDEQTYPSVTTPQDGETVGVGMPVIVNFDVPVLDRRSFEKHMSVTSTPAQPGTWHWVSDTEVHYRPKSYWQPGTDVKVDVGVNSIPAGNGIYGQENREMSFHVGSANVYRVNAETHQMRVTRDGQLLRTIPITTGKEGFATRSGTKIIVEKFVSRRMNSETVGIGGSEAYDIPDVMYAMRLTYSGEFLHAAPWSVGSQGVANVSHGCTGMSTENAQWLFDISKRGDVVVTTGTDRPMTLDNGYGDWNESFKDYQQASAL